MNRITGSMMGAVVVAAGIPGWAVASDGKDTLRKAAKALKSVRVVQYDAAYSAAGWVKPFVPTIEAQAIVGGQSEWDITRFHCKVKLTPSGLEHPIEMTAGSDGDVYYLIDTALKTVYQDMDPAVLGRHARNLQRIVLDDFASQEPLKEALEAEKVELKGSADVTGEACDRVVVKGESPAETHWFFSKSDHLPRRVQRVYVRNDERGTTELTLSNLRVNPKLTEDPFTLRVPAGYKKTDEFPP